MTAPAQSTSHRAPGANTHLPRGGTPVSNTQTIPVAGRVSLTHNSDDWSDSKSTKMYEYVQRCNTEIQSRQNEQMPEINSPNPVSHSGKSEKRHFCTARTLLVSVQTQTCVLARWPDATFPWKRMSRRRRQETPPNGSSAVNCRIT